MFLYLHVTHVSPLKVQLDFCGAQWNVFFLNEKSLLKMLLWLCAFGKGRSEGEGVEGGPLQCKWELKEKAW